MSLSYIPAAEPPDAVASMGTPMTAQQRAAFERDGFLIIPGALSTTEVEHFTAALDRVYARTTKPGEAMHLLSAVANCPDVAALVDHPRTLPFVWSMLGWNVHVYHSHLDVHPTVRGEKPFRFEWHQDGGRQNRELETDPRPRMSVKLAYWLSDVSQPGRGNFKVVPGSHLTNWIDGPPRRDTPWPEPRGAIEVTVNAGDAVFFDRRIWHARSDNHSDITRKAVFFGYTYRWIAGRDDLPTHPETALLNPVQRQLLGLLDDSRGDHAWGHYPESTPLHGALKEAGLLDPDHPPLKP